MKPVTRRRFLHPFEIGTANHNVDVLREHHQIPVHLFDLRRHSHSANHFIGDFFGREHIRDLMQGIDQTKKTFFKHEVDRFPFRGRIA